MTDHLGQSETSALARIRANYGRGLAANLDETGYLLSRYDEALAALKETDSWLWNKVVNGIYGPCEVD